MRAATGEPFTLEQVPLQEGTAPVQTTWNAFFQRIEPHSRVRGEIAQYLGELGYNVNDIVSYQMWHVETACPAQDGDFVYYQGERYRVVRQPFHITSGVKTNISILIVRDQKNNA